MCYTDDKGASPCKYLLRVIQSRAEYRGVVEGMILTPQYGFRSACCHAPIRMGRKKVKNSSVKIHIWICCKCSKRDVSLVQYNKDEPSEATPEKPNFASVNDDEAQDND
jgi:hypothetical protein